jgi:polyisoprenoid-binding protein YceI
MNKCGVLAALAAALLQSGPAQSQVASYDLLPEHTFVQFEVLHFGTSTLRGRMGPATGHVQLDRQGRRGELAVRMPTASVDTGVRVLDLRLRQADLLDSTAFPEAFFVASRFAFDAQGQLAEVRGEFTLRGTSQPLSLRAERFACRGEGADEVCGGDFVGTLLRSDFGATFGLPLVADRVTLRVQVQARRR